MPKIMVVDDEPDVILVLRGTLKKEGYEILGVNGGEECLSKLEKESPDLILLDIMMPKMDGIAVLKKIKETSPDTAVVILTAYASLDSAIEAMRHDASYYLSKPYKPEELKLVIKNALEKRRLELELRESEHKYRSLVENANDAIFLANPKDGRFLEANPKTEELTGYTRDELLGMSFFDVYPDRDTAMLGFQRVLEKGFAIFDSGLLLQKERSSIPVEFSANLLEFRKERVIQVIARDITERKKMEREIIETRDFLKSVLEGIGEGVAVIDRDFRIILANKMYIDQVKKTKKKVVGAHCYEVSHRFDKPCSELGYGCPVLETFKTGEPSRSVHTYFGREGGKVFVVVNAYPLGDLKSDRARVIESIVDITEQVHLEQEIQETKDYLESLIENAGDGIVALDKDGTITSCNIGTKEIFGYDEGEILGKHMNTLVPEDGQDEAKGLLERVSGGEVIRNYETKMKKNDGATIDVVLTISPIKDAYRNMVGISVIMRDITERKKAEEKIKQLKEFNESIVEKMEEGILMEDAEGCITFANPKVEKMLGLSKDELVGKHWSKIVSKSYQKKVEKETKKRPTGMKSKYEAALVSKDGKEIPVIVSATPLFEDGKFNGVLAVLTDITERKKAEEEMRTKTMKYRVERGGTYLVKEKRLEKGMDVLLDLLKCGYKGLIITRTRPEEIKKICEVEVPIVWLSEKKYDEMTIPPESFLIEKTIENYLDRDRAVLLDRLDYLITKNGFKETLDFIQKLNEAFYIAKGMLVVSLDPAILDAHELSLLEKEFEEAKLKYEPSFPADLYEMLEFVREQNRIGKKPTHKDIESKFKITRTTARKRINKLKHEGIVEDSKWGKFKVLALTEKGKALF